MTRLHALLLEYGSFDIPLEKVAKPYFDMEYKRASALAAVQQLPIPAYRAGKQKSPWLVSAKDLADLLDKRQQEAATEWKKMQA